MCCARQLRRGLPSLRRLSLDARRPRDHAVTEVTLFLRTGPRPHRPCASGGFGRTEGPRTTRSSSGGHGAGTAERRSTGGARPVHAMRLRLLLMVPSRDRRPEGVCQQPLMRAATGGAILWVGTLVCLSACVLTLRAKPMYLRAAPLVLSSLELGYPAARRALRSV